MVIVLPGCAREIAALPDEIRVDLADALARREVGLMLTMPLSRAMPALGRGVYELRLKDRSGADRVVYALARSSRRRGPASRRSPDAAPADIRPRLGAEGSRGRDWDQAGGLR
jgi:hypothetical protein